MVQTVQLAIGTATADSADIVIAAKAVVGIYADTGFQLDSTALAHVYQKTPGGPSLIDVLDSTKPTWIYEGPNTLFVRRVLAGVPIGVFSE